MSRSHCWNDKGPLFLVLVTGLVMRISLLLWYLSTHDWIGETWEYEAIANSLLDGKGFVYPYNNVEYRSYTVPIFPLLSAALHLLGGPGLALHYVFLLSSAAAVIWLTYTLALRWFGVETAAASAVLVALEPGLVLYQSYKLDVIGWATLLILVGIHTFCRLAHERRKRDAVLLGVVIGIGVLSRPDIVALASLLVVWLFSERDRWRQTAGLAAIVLATSIVVISPWVVRNSLVHGQPVLMTTTAGIWLWLGNNSNATGTAVTVDGRNQLAAASESFQERVLAAGELEQTELFTRAAIEYIKDDPIGFLGRMTQRFFYFWWFTPTFAMHMYDWLPSKMIWLYKTVYAVILGLAGMGLWSTVKDGDPFALKTSAYLLVPVLALVLIHSINYVEGRHRVMVMPMILILAGHGMAVLFKRCSQSTLKIVRQ